MSKGDAGALLLIRYGVSRKQACKNSLSKWRSVHHVYEGCVSGVAGDVQILEGYWPHDKGVALLSFESMKDAIMWHDCIPEIKQHDWMDGPDMVLVPLEQHPPVEKRFIQILDMEFIEGRQNCYQEHYVPGAKSILQNHGATESVVATGKPQILKGSWNPQFLIINFWNSEDNFHQAYCSEEYAPLKAERQTMTKTSAIVFPLEDLFPRTHSC